MKRLEALDRKEGYFLDLAAEEGWPKQKLRERIDVIRQEIADIKRTIEQADQRLDVGQRLLHAALALLNWPSDAYRAGSERVRLLLNRAFFARLSVDGEKIAGHELQEPFDVLLGAYEQYVITRTSTLPSHETAKSAELLTDSGAHDREFPADSTRLTWQVSGWSSAAMVGGTGIEPVTSSVRMRPFLGGGA
ncbi:hypothetical protein KDL01_20925, partial [Actinospica durhamensis]